MAESATHQIRRSRAINSFPSSHGFRVPQPHLLWLSIMDPIPFSCLLSSVNHAYRSKCLDSQWTAPPWPTTAKLSKKWWGLVRVGEDHSGPLKFRSHWTQIGVWTWNWTGNCKGEGMSEKRQTSKIFVGGLSWETTDQRLRTYFENYGAVSEAFVSFDRVTGKTDSGFWISHVPRLLYCMAPDSLTTLNWFGNLNRVSRMSHIYGQIAYMLS